MVLLILSYLIINYVNKIVKINNIRSGFALGEGSRDFGSKMMEIDKIENMKIKYSEEKKNLLQLMFIKVEDIGSLIVHKTLSVCTIRYCISRCAAVFEGKTNHLNNTSSYYFI